MKAVNLLINSLLPADLRDPNRPLDKKNLDQLLTEVALRDPHRAASLIKEISDIGRNASYHQGETITLADMKSPIDKEAIMKDMDRELSHIRSKNPEGPKREAAEIGIYQKYSDQITKDTIAGALAKGNNIGNTVISGARGNPTQLRGMLTTPAFYTDYRDRAIPLFVRNSFGEGLRPAEYLTSTFGVRKAILSTKQSTAKGGALGKQLAQNTAHIVVTQHDCGTTNGLDMEVTDPDLKRRVLAQPVGDIAAGTLIDRHVLQKLKQQGVSKVIVRSPLTCQAPEGICSECHGAMANYKLPSIGESVGVTAGQAFGEPLTTSALQSKHTAGAAGSAKKEFSGLDAVRQFMQTPEVFPNKAAVSEEDGKVTNIQPAAQGGTYITVGEHQHYALPDLAPTVKAGDHVEAGDVLSEGLADPYDIVRLRGLGEGRRYYADRLGQMMSDSGLGRPTKLNLELIARGALDSVRITDDEGFGHYLPDDVASYSSAVQGYSPPADTATTQTKKADGMYLQSPVLHYTIGTRLTPKMLNHIHSTGVENVAASPTKPGFEPEMIRLQGAGYEKSDWLAKLNTSQLGRNLEHDAERSRDTSLDSNINFAPRLAIGKDFGKTIHQNGRF